MIRDNKSGSKSDLEFYEVDQMRIFSLYFVLITIWIKISFIFDKKFETNQNQMKKNDFEHVSFSFKVSGVSNQRCW